MRSAIPLLLLLLFLPFYLVVQQASWQQQADVRQSARSGYVMPSRFSRVMALGNKGLFSDYLFLKGMTFVGERFLYKEPMSEEDWRFFIAILDTVTDLDPYFLDPYVLAESLLTWEAGEFEEANRLLEKGRRYKKAEWRLPFYIGFNHFYFLKDYEKGAQYIMEAARIPGSPSYLTTLAGRLNYYGGKSKTGILFLKEMLAENPDPRLGAQLETRIAALEIAAQLEDLLEKFRKEKGRSSESLEELITVGYIDRLPVDPYGGQWVILPSGRVFSTSRFVPSEKE